MRAIAKKVCVIILLLLAAGKGYAQLNANTWYFGTGIGLDFNCTKENSGSPPQALLNGGMKTTPGGASAISDSCGTFLFYSNGDSIWNNMHNVLPAPGNMLVGSRKATQNSLFVPHPGNPQKYYLFTLDDRLPAPGFGRLSYSEINLGIITVGNKKLTDSTDEMITAVSHADGISTWVITKLRGKSTFKAYRISKLGIDTIPVISKAGVTDTAERGQLKASPDGTMLATRMPLMVYKFNNLTGAIQDWFSLNNSFLEKGSSVEFSPDSKKLYINNYANLSSTSANEGIYVYDLSSGNPATIEPSGTRLKNPPLKGGGPVQPAKGGLQLGPDNRIYVIQDPTYNKVGVIMYPAASSDNANFLDTFIRFPMPNQVGMFFPTFNQSLFQESYFSYRNNCFGDSTLFIYSWLEFPKFNDVDSARWEFGDSLNSFFVSDNKIFPNTGFRYAKPGCYVAHFKLYTNDGGVTTTAKTVKINALPTLDLGPDTTLCKKPRFLTLFAASSDNIGATYEWYYKTFSADSGPQDPSHVDFPIDYGPLWDAKEPGIYWMRKHYQCCYNTDTVKVFFDSINSNFRYNKNIQCEKDNKFVYWDVSVPKAVHSEWEFGDNTGTIGDTVQKSYKTTGAYYVKLTSTSQRGCIGSITRPVLVIKHPKANFTVDTTELCFKGNIFHFKDTSTLEFGNGSIQGYQYDFGDATGLSAKDATKSYTQFGQYQVKLIVTSSQNCRDTARKTISVFEQPSAGFTINLPEQCYNGHEFIYTDTTHPTTQPAVSKLWDFGNGNQAEGVGKPAEFKQKYPYSDTFFVELKVFTSKGCVDSVIHPIIVSPNPYVNFSIDNDKQCLRDNVFNFKDTAHVTSGSMVDKFWTFGDGSNSASSGLNKVYYQYGNFTIWLKEGTDRGCYDSVQKQVTVYAMPTAAFVTNDSSQCFTGHSFVFSANPTFVPQGSITKYNWDFGNSTNSSLKNPPALTYTSDSSKKVMLRVETDHGCVDTVFHGIYFSPNPVAVITVNDSIQCQSDNVFKFSAKNTTVSSGGIADYDWYFKDGTIDHGMTPLDKSYFLPDSFNVTLIVTTGKGCIDSTHSKIVVLPTPKPDFIVKETCLRLPSGFIDKTTLAGGNITKWGWQFGDGDNDTIQNPVHQYLNTGSYNVELAVESDQGCKGKAYKNAVAVVKPLPEADFSYERIDFDQKNTTIKFRDNSTDAAEYQWDLGKGHFSTLSDPEITYDDTGTLNVSLIVRNPEGCYDTTYKRVFVAPEFMFYVPNAFTPNEDQKNPFYGGEGTQYFKDYSLKIFNRWGEKVFEATNASERWDGTFKGEPCPVGAYTYVYRMLDVFGNYHNYRGVINLIR